MKRVTRHKAATLNLPTLKLEGGLFLPDVLEKAALGSGRLQADSDYGIPKGLKQKDEYSRSFQIATALWRHFEPQMDRSDMDAGHASATFISDLLRTALAYPVVGASTGISVADRHYPITHMASNGQGAQLPIVIAPHNLGLDDADPRYGVRHADGSNSGTRKKSPFQLMQELLNASPDYHWGLVTNGKTIRLLRDAATLTRPSYLDIDVADLLSGQRYSEFAYAWRLLHASRAGLLPSNDPDKSSPVVWEVWREAGQEEGTRVRNGLRLGVTQALLTFGNGFIQHPANDALRAALQNGDLKKEEFFAQLLRLIYRLIFVFSVEERGLLQTNAAYAQGYSLARLRDLSLRRRARTRFDDLWQSVRILFKALAHGEARLGLPALGGLFDARQCPALDGAELSNAHLLAAMQSMRWAAQAGGNLAPIDYRNMGVEELGSVYESLLELVPEVDLPAKTFGFVGLTSEGSTAGNERKLTGSYYTPDSLVQELIQSALEPVIEDRVSANPENPVEALLSIKVCDPACGSGHFLLAAARKLAERLAALRSEDGVVSPAAYRHALREVIARCIFGVDRNPMAIELARTALWLEGFEEGRPLSFLDHHLQVGDALLGLTDLKALEFGIPKDAFKPLSGDDKEVCKHLAKTNTTALKQIETERKSKQARLELENNQGLNQLRAIEMLAEGSTAEIEIKAQAYADYLKLSRSSNLAKAANALLGAFLLPKTVQAASTIPTTSTLFLLLQGAALPADQQEALVAAQAACDKARVFHWPLAFPQAFAQGGFDCVLGNPPWERIKLQEEEFFATRHPEVAKAANKAERSQRIQWLSTGSLGRNLYPNLDHPDVDDEIEKRLYREFIVSRRTAEAASVFAHVAEEDGGRFPLTGVGDVNTYALFSETILRIYSSRGRAGFIVPTGIATDDSTKAFFGHISQNGRLVSLYDIENSGGVFPAVHRSYKFCLMTLGIAEQAEFVCFINNVDQLRDERRRFTLSPGDFILINPNTLTCPIFRSSKDAELTKSLYRNNVALKIKNADSKLKSDWNIVLRRMFDKSTDSKKFLLSSKAAGNENYLQLYEGGLGHQYNHRFAEFRDGREPECSLEQLSDPEFIPRTEWSISRSDFLEKCESMRLMDLAKCKTAFLGFRRVARNTDERTVIACVIPWQPMTYGWILSLGVDAKEMALLCGAYNSLVFDYLMRTSLSQPSIPQGAFEQVALPPLSRFSKVDENFILTRVLELTYTANDLKAWAVEIGHKGPPFPFQPERRAQLRAELDAYYARLYGLTRNDLRYILDPTDLMGEDYPSETFRVLRDKELRELKEFRTQRLVLEAWDALENGTLQ